MNRHYRRTQKSLLAIFMSALLVGCGGTKVVFVHPTDRDLVRLGPDVRGHVYFWNGSEWELSKNELRLPEGWYAGYVPPEGEDLPEPSPDSQVPRSGSAAADSIVEAGRTAATRSLSFAHPHKD